MSQVGEIKSHLGFQDLEAAYIELLQGDEDVSAFAGHHGDGVGVVEVPHQDDGILVAQGPERDISEEEILALT